MDIDDKICAGVIGFMVALIVFSSLVALFSQGFENFVSG